MKLLEIQSANEANYTQCCLRGIYLFQPTNIKIHPRGERKGKLYTHNTESATMNTM